MATQSAKKVNATIYTTYCTCGEVSITTDEKKNTKFIIKHNSFKHRTVTQISLRELIEI